MFVCVFTWGDNIFYNPLKWNLHSASMFAWVEQIGDVNYIL